MSLLLHVVHIPALWVFSFKMFQVEMCSVICNTVTRMEFGYLLVLLLLGFELPYHQNHSLLNTKTFLNQQLK